MRATRRSDQTGLRGQVLDAMRAVFGADERRIGHAMKVLGFAESILAREGGEAGVVVAAAILHDIGIHQAEAKYHSAAGRYQEIEGPPIARAILEKLSLPADTIEHVCRIIANHHSARDIDTREFRIIWDADWLVNLPEEFPSLSPEETARRIDRIFKTAAGKELATSLYVKPGGRRP